MGSPNQLRFIKRHAERLAGPFLEVGSKDYGSTEDLRAVFADKGRYVGVDLEAGPGVDRVLDLTGDTDTIDVALDRTRFGTVFCLSVLEHCRRPFAMAENLARLLAPGGRLVVAVPFAFKYHAYPGDYWRFTHEGIRELFAGLDFPAEDAAVATSIDGELMPLDEELGRIVFGSKSHWRRGRYLRGVSAKAFALAARLGVFRWFAGYRYVLPPTEILMLGSRRP